MAHTAPDELRPRVMRARAGVSIAYQVMGAGPDVVLVSGMLNNIAASWQEGDGDSRIRSEPGARDHNRM